MIDLVLPVSAVLILISDLVLTFSVWGWGHAWIELSLGLLVLLGILGGSSQDLLLVAKSKRKLDLIH